MNFLVQLSRSVSNSCFRLKSIKNIQKFQTLCSNQLVFNNSSNFSKINCNSIENQLNERNKWFCRPLIKRQINTKNSSSDNESEDSSTDESRDLKKSIETKFKKYSDDNPEVIYDISEELEIESQRSDEWTQEEKYLYQQRVRRTVKLGENLKRGLTGVFDIHELVDLLRSENLNDIAVIEVPEELDYCQYLVLANALSKRHLNAFVEYFNKVYKAKKAKKDPFLNFGGVGNNEWKVVDMKNIVLHLFMKTARDHYDIETLWTVGHEFDDKTQRPEPDSVVDIMEKHIKFLQELNAKQI